MVTAFFAFAAAVFAVVAAVLITTGSYGDAGLYGGTALICGSTAWRRQHAPR